MARRRQQVHEADDRDTAAPVIDIRPELQRIANLLAMSMVKDQPQPEQIALLKSAGYSPAEIATLLATTANTVSVTLSKQKTGRKKSATRKVQRRENSG